jgi:hypothetical protein
MFANPPPILRKPSSSSCPSYTWTIVSGASSIDPNVVFGLFTYDLDDPAQSHREIDVEFSKWSNPSDTMNAQFVLQPYDVPNHRQVRRDVSCCARFLCLFSALR